MQQHAGPQQQVVGEKRSRICGSAAVTGGSRGCSDGNQRCGGMPGSSNDAVFFYFYLIGFWVILVRARSPTIEDTFTGAYYRQFQVNRW